jgi:hypothetical protein
MIQMTKELPHVRGRVGHMSRGRRLRLYGVSLATWITGVVWLIFHYFVRTVDQFGFEVPHPGEKWSLISHALVSFYAIWWFGLLWPNHVKSSWKLHIRRTTGGVLFGCVAWLSLTGWALYYIGSDRWRSWTSVSHWIVGVGGLIAFVVHLLTRTARAPGRQ